MKNSKFTLSKSKFISGLQCTKKMWLSVHRPELATPLSKKQEQIFQAGFEFEEIVMKKYPDSVKVDFNNLNEMVSITKKLINDGVNTIFQAAFYYDNCYVISDLIRRVAENIWQLKEIKSSTEVKDVHIPDLAIQRYVLENNGLNIDDTFVIHINTEGTYPDLDSIIKIENTTEQVSNYRLGNNIQRFQEIISNSHEPDCRIGNHCREPYLCEFKDYCWKDVSKYSVFHIPHLKWKKKEQLYNNGIKTIQDINSDYPLPVREREYVDRLINNKIKIDKDGIRSKLSELNYPLHFFDFETTSPPIPLWDGTRPHERIPFQWSCHKMQANGDIEHFEYLHPENSDPRRKLSEEMIKCIENEGSVIVYNAGFERGELRKLANLFPDLSQQISSIEQRIWDQIEIFRQYYKDYRFGNTNSIKAVLPVIRPDLNHDNLELSSGDEADIFWFEMLSENDEERRETLRNNLLEYCKLDTYAMVAIHQHLQNL